MYSTDEDDTDDECVDPFVGWERWLTFSLMLFVIFVLCLFFLPFLYKTYCKGVPDRRSLPNLFSAFVGNFVFVLLLVFLLSVYPCAYGGLEVWLFICSLFSFFPSFGSYCFGEGLDEEVEEGRTGKWYLVTYHFLVVVLIIPFAISFSVLRFPLGAIYLVFSYFLPSLIYLFHAYYPSPKRTNGLLGVHFFLVFFLLCLFYQEGHQTYDQSMEKRDFYFVLILFFSLPIHLWGYSILRWGGWLSRHFVSAGHPHQKFLAYSTTLCLAAFIISSCVVFVFMGFPAIVFDMATGVAFCLFFFSMFFGAQDYARVAFHDPSPSLSPARLFFHTPGLLFLGLLLMVAELFDFHKFTCAMSLWLVVLYHLTAEGMLTINGVGLGGNQNMSSREMVGNGKNGGGGGEGNEGGEGNGGFLFGSEEGNEQGTGTRNENENENETENENGTIAYGMRTDRVDSNEENEKYDENDEKGKMPQSHLGGVEIEIRKGDEKGEFKGFGSDDNWETIRNSWDDGGIREMWETGRSLQMSYDNLRTPNWEIGGSGGENSDEETEREGLYRVSSRSRSRRGSYGSGGEEGERGGGEGEREEGGGRERGETEDFAFWKETDLVAGGKRWGYVMIVLMLLALLFGFWLFLSGILMCEDGGLFGFLLVFCIFCLMMFVFILYFTIFLYYKSGDCRCGSRKEDPPFVEEGEMGEMAGETQLLNVQDVL